MMKNQNLISPKEVNLGKLGFGLASNKDKEKLIKKGALLLSSSSSHKMGKILLIFIFVGIIVVAIPLMLDWPVTALPTQDYCLWLFS